MTEDPRSMAAVRALLAQADPDASLARCGLDRVVVDARAADALPDVVAGLVAALPAPVDGPARVVVLVDRVRILRGDTDLKAHAVALLQGRFAVTTAVLDDGHAELHVTEDVVEEATRAVAGADVVVALGGGTISDIGKLAAAAAEVPGLVTVQTAASVDGYSDDVSVLLRDGVKRTVPSRWPDVLLADLETVAGAPEEMNRAGYGEMTSMFAAPADWRLAALLDVDPSFHPAAIALLEHVGSDLDDWSAGLRTAEPAAVGALTWALTVRGVVTGVAGSTAALSGVEHLFSHMLDLRAAAGGLPTGLHGAQVGVGTVLAATAWEALDARIAATGGTLRLPDPEVARARVDATFGALDPTGRIAAECWRDYSTKLAALHAQADRLQAVVAGWSEHGPALAALRRPSADVARGLRAAGAAALPADLGVDRSVAHWALAGTALMRNRVTVVDLLTALGWWTDDDVAAVLDDAERTVRVEEHVGAGHGA